MSENKEQKTYFAIADYRGKNVQFGIKAEDRTKHVYVIGKTGMGKSTLLENMAAQDIMNGNGIAFIDPHGSAVETLLDYVPEHRVKDVIYFAPFDLDYPVSFNVMEDVGYDKRHLVVSGLMSAFKKIWVDAWSARMEYILSNVLFALLEYPDSTLIDVNRMLVDKEFRKKVISHIKDPIIKSFWVDEFSKYTDKYTAEATPAIQNKIGQFISNPIARNIIGQPKSSFDFRKVMDEKKILLMNLSKGQMGDVNSKLIGSMLIIKIYLAAMSRADTSKAELVKLPNFYFFVDEFQAFANETFAEILSESRKYKLNLTIAHQYIEQMPEEVRDAVFGNVGTMITFRVGAQDAEMFEKEYFPTFLGPDLVNLGFAQIYLKLMIDGLGSKPFSATTLPPLAKSGKSFREQVIANSRASYAAPRAKVEEAIIKRQEEARAANEAVAAAAKVSGTFAQNGGRERAERDRRDFSPARDRGEDRSFSPQRSSSSGSQSDFRPREFDRPRFPARDMQGGDMRQPVARPSREELRPREEYSKPMEAPSQPFKKTLETLVKAESTESIVQNVETSREIREPQQHFSPQQRERDNRPHVIRSAPATTGPRQVNPQQESMPLNLLRNQHKPAKEHTPSQDHLNDLKSALSEVLKSTSQNTTPQNTSKPEPAKIKIPKPISQMEHVSGSKPSQSHTHLSTPPEKPHGPKEIPEDELRKMLAIEEGGESQKNV